MAVNERVDNQILLLWDGMGINRLIVELVCEMKNSNGVAKLKLVIWEA